MARTITDIHADLTSTLVTEMAAINITINPATWSKANLLRLITYVVAVCQWTIEQLQDAHKAEVNEIIWPARSPSAGYLRCSSRPPPGSSRWCRRVPVPARWW